ncbi:MAG: sulfur transferase domain-containing protein [Luteimonas sp.]|nr:sulfur transferase domain-containing protein [Luteimonas sp.]
MTLIRCGLALCIATVLAACAGTSPVVADAAPVHEAPAAKTGIDAIPGLHAPRANLLTSGQPAQGDWVALAAQGVTTVVNLRTDAEMAGRDEAAEVEAAGMAYHHLPIASADELTSGNAAQLRALLEGAQGTLLVHCASANRAGALLAVGAVDAGEMTPQQALEFGRSAGLTSPRFEAQVRPRLGLPDEGAE